MIGDFEILTVGFENKNENCILLNCVFDHFLAASTNEKYEIHKIGKLRWYLFYSHRSNLKKN